MIDNQEIDAMKLLNPKTTVLCTEKSDVVAMYVKPFGSEETADMVEKLPSSLAVVYNKGPTILACDFKARLDRLSDSRTQAFRDTVCDFGLWIITGSSTPTFSSPMERSVIDVFATNLPPNRCLYLGENTNLRERANPTWHTPVGINVKTPHKSAPERKPPP